MESELPIPNEFLGCIIGEKLVESVNRENKVHLASKNSKKCIVKFSQNIYIQKEFEIMKSIHHENIFPVEEYNNIGDLRGYSMPYAQGGDLFDYIGSYMGNDILMPEENARFLMKQILTAISHIHSLQIIHHDIKPENFFFLDPDRQNLRLADFGSAIKFDEKRTYLGSFGFRAPEIIRYKQYDCKVDCWAAGIIMYLMLYNKYPFSNDGILSEYSINRKRIISGNVIFQEGLRSKDAEDLISKLLAPKKEDRIPASDALKHEWFTSNDLVAQCHEICSDVLYQLGQTDQDINDII